MRIEIVKTKRPEAHRKVAALRERLRAATLVATGVGAARVAEDVRKIVEDVRKHGDRRVIYWTNKFDKSRVTAGTLRVSRKDIKGAKARVERGFLELVGRVRKNIEAYQEYVRVAAPRKGLVRKGRRLEVRYTPLDRVGVYVPGGRGFYPSTVLMTVIPAQAGGVREIAMACPPTHDGDINPMVLALAGELGVEEVYRMSGAQAIAALAFGTATIPAVDKIVGPGNAFVAEAKRQVFGRVGIDSTAGPSEVLIIADATARAEWLAADLLAQAEHAPGSAILVTTSEALARQVVEAIERQLPSLERRAAIEPALREYSLIIVVPDVDAACDVANYFAPEHLQIVTGDDEAVLAKVRHAGAIFLGPHTPVPLGDYLAGPSHVLPTGGTARFFGPLSVNDFLKATSVIRYDAGALAEDADDVMDFARREGLTAHARAIAVRTGKD